jgi:hypothetical protein
MIFGSAWEALQQSFLPKEMRKPRERDDLQIKLHSGKSDRLKNCWHSTAEKVQPAEVCALKAKYVPVDARVISVRQSESLGHVLRPKTQDRSRIP